MKKIILNSGLGLLTVFMLLSCHDGNNGETYVSYGVIQNVVSKSNYEILTDKGNTLIVTKSQTNQEIKNDKRVIVNFEILSDKGKSSKKYEVEVNGFYNLLSKPLVKESYILLDETTRRDSIGNDPFCSIYAWFGGDYININFEMYYKESSGRKHLINLVYDDTNTSTDTLYLRLHQNAYGEVPAYNDMYLRRGEGRCSFKLSDILPAEVDEKPVKLVWKEYRSGLDVVECADTGVFRKGNYEEAAEKSSTNTEFDDSLTVD
ncbi:MAG: hypothetical protein LBD80_05345 [Tannerella sp.]|jgi:hypothetical protein|nr:hypothetical protein [Tannerella sp.]